MARLNRRPTFDVTFENFGPAQYRTYLETDSGRDFLRTTLGRNLERYSHIAGGADRVKDAFIFTFLTDVWSYAEARAEVDELARGGVELYLKKRDGRVGGIPEHDRSDYQIEVASQLASQATARDCVYLSRSVLKLIFNGKPVRFYLLKHGPRVLYLAGDVRADVSDEVARKKGKVSVNFNGLAFEMAHNTPEEMKACRCQRFKFEPTAWKAYDDGAPDVYCTYKPGVVDDEGRITELHTSALLITAPPELASYSPAELVEHAKSFYRENMLFGETTRATLRMGFIAKTKNMQNKPVRRPVGAATLGACDFPASDFRFTAEDEKKLARLRTILTQLHADVMRAEGDGMYLATLEAGASDFVLTAAGDDADDTAKARAAVLKQTLDEQELASGKTQATAAPGQEEATDVGQICSEDSSYDAVKQWITEKGTDPSVLSPDLLAFLAAVRQPSGKRQKKAPSGKKQKKAPSGKRQAKTSYEKSELSELLHRYLGDEHTYTKPVVGREKAGKALKKALEQEMGNKWGVITIVGVPGSGKTFFLRAGILREWYPKNSVMMTYFEDARILDDGKMDVTTAFARQLAQSNRGRCGDIDFGRIRKLDTVVAAFRVKLGLDDSEMLIVCIDGLICLRDHIAKKTSTKKTEGLATGHARCKELKAALMAYQDKCTSDGKPEIRFVWTSLTEHFETSLMRTESSGRQLHLIPLRSLSEEASWELLGDLKEKSASDSLLRWGFYLCAGNPRALDSGLTEYEKPSEDCDPVAAGNEVEALILQACRLSDYCYLKCVSDHLCTVLASPTSLDPRVRERLLMSGVLHHSEDGTLRLHPALVRKWAGACRSRLQRLVHEYFKPERFEEETAFEQQTYVFEQILNCAYAELELKPTLQEYFAGAEFCGDAARLRRLVVHPRQLPCLSVFRPCSLEAEEVKRRLEAGATVSQERIEASGSSSCARFHVLIPLHLAEAEAQSPRTHIFCCQGRRDDVDARTNAKAVRAVSDALHLQDAHGLHLTTQDSGNTGERTGVWFTQKSLEQWLGRMATIRYSHLGLHATDCCQNEQ